MTIFTDGPRLASPGRPITDYDTSWGSQLGATASEAWSDSPVSQILGLTELNAAAGGARAAPETDPLGNPLGGPQTAEEGPSVPTVSRADALERLKQAGLDKRVTLPAGDTFATPVLDIMMQRARERAERESTIERGPQGFFAGAAELGTSFLVGAVDPINLATAFIPVMGELRYAKLMASAGESALARGAVRAGVGAAQGAVGQAVLEPLDWYAHTQEGRDFGMADVLRNLVFGAALGGGLQSGGGAIADVYRGRRGRALYPFGPGDPLENVPGARVSGQALADGVPATGLPDELLPVIGEIENILSQASTPPALRVLRDLPPRAQEDSMRAAIAAITSGEPVRVGEMLAAAAKTDPRIAESFEAFHGSPHEFDRFDISKIGTGEGAQSYGHGLYFAEREAVAESYRQALGDAKVDGKPFDINNPLHRAAALIDEFGSRESALEKARGLAANDIGDFFVSVVRHLESDREIPKIEANGHIYKVNIKADREHFLDLDKPLAEQSEHVRRALLDHPDPAIAGTAEKHGYDVRNMMRRIGYHVGPKDMDSTAGREAAAARALSEAGIPGVKYLDEGSRTIEAPEADLARRIEVQREIDAIRRSEQPTAEQHRRYEELTAELARIEDAIRQHREQQQTRNYVVFDDKHVEITHRNGEPLPLSVGEPAAREGGQAGLPGEGPGRADGAEPRTAGAGDRAPGSTALDQEADWRDLMRRADELDDPDIIAASRAADAAPEVKTRLDDRVAAAEKADAESAELMRLLANGLPEESRTRLEDALKAVDEEQKLNTEVIERAAACVFRGHAA